MNSMKQIVSKIYRKILSKTGLVKTNSFEKISYSQSGEDLIVEFIFQTCGLPNPSYIDIGAFNPRSLSNTALFYRKGCRGVNIEPNPEAISQFVKYRPHDVNLNLGISAEKGMLEYYFMNIPTMNTFDAAVANELVEKEGFSIVGKKSVPVESLTNVINQYCGGRFPDFLSLDVEGLDQVILAQIDFSKNFPKVICVETVEYKSDGTGKKNTELLKYLENNGYMIYADTFINTIFVHRKFWFGEGVEA